MRLIVGLGNPGKDYVGTRHNAGFLVADELKKTTESTNLQINKSQNFMNESGGYVNELIHWYKVDPKDLYIIHDDLDIPLGQYKIQFGKGPKDHNGVKSVNDVLGTDQYWHVRVGIDNRTPKLKNSKTQELQNSRTPGIEYVLQNFTDEERKILDEAIKRLVKELISTINE